MVEIKPIQSCLIQLNHISYRLSWANIFQEEVNEQMASILELYPQKRVAKLQAESKMILEHMFLNLHHLFEIHDSILGKIIHEIGFDELLKSLKPLWCEIEKIREKIKLWRHNYIAHGKSQAKNFLTFRELDPNYEETIKQVFSISRIACLYIHTIFENIPADYRLAISLQKLRIQELGGEWEWKEYLELWKKMDEEEQKLIENTNKILKKNGFSLVSEPFFNGQDLKG